MELGATAPAMRRRSVIYVLVFGIALINYWDRAVLSIAIPVLIHEFHLTTVTAGYLLSAFVFTYAIAQLPAGIVLDWVGTRRAGAGSLAVWSVATALTACVTGVANLFLTRLLLGLGESVTMPLTARAVREWAPVRERGFAQAFVHSGLPVGTAIASIVVGATVGALGWRTAFVLSGAMGLIWAVIWFAVYREPMKCRWLGKVERELILADRPAAPATGADATVNPLRGLSSLMRKRTMWGLFLTQGCVNYANYFLLSWLPSYFIHAYGININGSGQATGIVYFSAAVLMVCFGAVSDRVTRRYRVEAGKRRYVVAALALGGSVIGLAPLLSSHVAQLTVMAISTGCVLSVFANNVSLANDLLADPRYVGTAVGWLQFGGNVFGLAAPVATGYIVAHTGGYTAAFGVAGAFLLAGALAAITMTREPVSGL
jgi:ACS family glucarate transporter-like MFS transporter